MIHNSADVQSRHIGEGTSIWQYVVVLPDARIGSNCNICSHVLIENDVTIGDNVTIKSGVQVWDGVTIRDGAFLGPNVTFCNDRLPRSKKRLDSWERTTIGDTVSIGANATILPGVSIGKLAMVGAGSVVTKSVGPNELWFGNPAVHRGYVTVEGKPLGLDMRCPHTGADFALIDGVIVPK